MSAVERGDIEKAQKMVGEAAKKAKYTERVFHGTRGDDHRAIGQIYADR